MSTGPLVVIQDETLPPALFRKLLRKVRQVGRERLERTYQTTFWFDLTRPSNVVEEAILALRHWVPAPPSVVGVEWWLSRMDTNRVGVDFHRDRDEKLAGRTGRIIHPKLSSVLFLNRVKGGLLAVSAGRPNAENPACAPDRIDFALVRPLPNRLALFPGDRTHGVLDTYNRLPGKTSLVGHRLRLAVVINWWHRRPLQVPRFSETQVYRTLAERQPASATTRSMHRRPRRG